MPTTTELSVRVAKRLGIIDPSESLTAAEADDITAVMNSVYDSMKERGHINWTLTSIPTMYQDAFINVVAYRVASDFGALTQDVVMRGQQGEREIYALNARSDDPRQTPPVDY